MGQSIQTVPAKGQLARLVSEMLPTARTAGWVQILSSSSELQGFELVGDFAKVVDGAGPATEGKQLAVIDFSREDIVHLVNTSSQAGTVQVTLNDAAGKVLATRPVPLAPFQPASLRLGDVSDDNNIDLVSLSSDVTIAASLTTKLPGGLDIGLTNATPISGAPSTLFFPFAPNGPQGASTWTTYLGISNLGSAAQSVSLTFTPDAGAPVTIQRNLAPGASLGDTAVTLFGLSASAFTAGWIRVSGSAGLIGAAAYQDSANGSLAIVPSQSSGATAFFFGHIASLSPWYTGIALLNTAATAANVEVYAIDSSGQLVGSPATFSLPAGRRTALLSEFVAPVLQRASDGGWVFVKTTNNVPLLGFELFGHAVAPILANVQGFALPSNSTFTPPSGGGGGSTDPGSANIDRLLTMDDTETPTSQFSPGDVIAYVARITNSGTRDPAQLTFSVKDPRNQTLFTSGITITLPASSADMGLTSFIPSNALNGQYTFSATLTYQGKTVSKSTTFFVSGGTNSPSVGQETPIAMSLLNTPQVAFRPGETVRFLITTANFTGDAVQGVLNYQFTGPGLFNAGTGSVTYSIPAGISFKTIDRVIPEAAQQGLFVFTSNLTASGALLTKTMPVTVVPKSASEAIDIDKVFVEDLDGIPRGGFKPGSNVVLAARRVSSFPVTVPATIRYTVTAPNGSALLDQPLSIDVPNGAVTRVIPFSLSADAAAGTYTVEVTVTYQDNSNATKTSSGTTTFVVGGDPPALTPTVTSQRLYVADINLVARSTFSPGEPFFLIGTAYSTSPTRVPGTMLYQLTSGSNTLFGRTYTMNFDPGMNAGLIGLLGSISTGTTLTFSLTSTIPASQPSTTSTSFLVSGPDAPPLDLGLTSAVSKAVSQDRWKREMKQKAPGIEWEVPR